MSWGSRWQPQAFIPFALGLATGLLERSLAGQGGLGGSGRSRLRLSWFPGTAQLQASSPFRFLPTLLLSPPLGTPSSTAGAFTSRAICPAVPPRASQGVAVPSSLQLAGVVHRAPPPCRELPTPAPPERRPLQGLVQLTRGGHSPGSRRCSAHAACACMGARGTAEPIGVHCPGAGPPAPVPPELGPRGLSGAVCGVPVRGPSLVGPSLPAVWPGSVRTQPRPACRLLGRLGGAQLGLKHAGSTSA